MFTLKAFQGHVTWGNLQATPGNLQYVNYIRSYLVVYFIILFIFIVYSLYFNTFAIRGNDFHAGIMDK